MWETPRSRSQRHNLNVHISLEPHYLGILLLTPSLFYVIWTFVKVSYGFVITKKGEIVRKNYVIVLVITIHKVVGCKVPIFIF